MGKVLLRVEACGAQSNVSCGPPLGEASARAILRIASISRLFREATQLKTVAAAVRVVGEEGLRTEIQVQAVDAARGGRPAEPVIADRTQRAQVCDTVARGEPTGHFIGRLYPKFSPRASSRLFREATQLKTVAAIVCAAGIEPRHAEIQVHAIGTADRGSPAVTAVADVHRFTQSSIVACVAEARGDQASLCRTSIPLSSVTRYVPFCMRIFAPFSSMITRCFCAAGTVVSSGPGCRS